MKRTINSINDIELSVIVPMYNEEEQIQESAIKLTQVMEKIEDKWELIFVNDGSTDKTLELISDIVRKDHRVRVLSYPNNRGRGYALRTGIKCSKGRSIITTESDLSWGAEIIIKLYEEIKDSDADIVIASPYRKGGKLVNIPLRRAFLSWLGNKILRMTIPVNITMFTGMTRAYNGDIVRSLILEEDGKEIHLEIVSKAYMLDYKFREIPAILRWEHNRMRGTKKKTTFRAGKLIRSHLFFGFNEAPIILFGTLGFFVLLIGLIIGLYLFYLYLIKDQIIGDRVILIMTTVFLLLSGLQIFLFCFLSYQNRDLREELYKLNNKSYQILNIMEKKNEKNDE